MNVRRSFLSVLFIMPAIIGFFTFCTPIKETMIDADGNVYTTVKLGKQVWTVENLRTTKLNDGTPIPFITDGSEWQTCEDSARPAYCWYGNDSANKKTYGGLYTWFAVNTGKLAPKGWHVPTDTEWTELENYLVENGHNWNGTDEGRKVAKSMAATTGWVSNNDSGTVGIDISKNNRSGFSALPGGFRLERGDFFDVGYHAYWWSATEYDASFAWRRSLYYDKNNLIRNHSTLRKGCGFSVRLLKD
jgi:uncharacterized protein (TIGR02145 family)